MMDLNHRKYCKHFTFSQFAEGVGVEPTRIVFNTIFQPITENTISFPIEGNIEIVFFVYSIPPFLLKELQKCLVTLLSQEA
jgi:hypothetical protein